MYLRSAATNARTAPTYGAFLTYVNCAIREWEQLKHAPLRRRYAAVEDIVELMDLCHERNEHGLEAQLGSIHRDIAQKTNHRTPHALIETNGRLEVRYYSDSQAA